MRPIFVLKSFKGTLRHGSNGQGRKSLLMGTRMCAYSISMSILLMRSFLVLSTTSPPGPLRLDILPSHGDVHHRRAPYLRHHHKLHDVLPGGAGFLGIAAYPREEESDAHGYRMGRRYGMKYHCVFVVKHRVILSSQVACDIRCVNLVASMIPRRKTQYTMFKISRAHGIAVQQLHPVQTHLT